MSNSGCGSWLYFNRETGQCQRFFCGHSTCDRPECIKRFWLARVKLISELITDYSLDKFFTLTMTRDMPVEIAWKSIAGVWNKFLTMTRREYPGFIYVAVLERHEDGYPHVHGFTQTWVSQEWYSEKFAACGGGSIAWVERVKCTSSGEAASYVAKQLGRYVGKQNVVGAKRIIGIGKRTLWRSSHMKAAFELGGSSGKWVVLRGNFFDNEGKPTYYIEQTDAGFNIKPNGN